MMYRRNGTSETNRVGETGVCEMGVGEMGQIIGKTGVGEMGVGEMGVIPYMYLQKAISVNMKG